MNCLSCAKELAKRKRKESKFCNAQCMADFRKKTIVENWEKDSETANTKHGLSDTIRTFLIERADNKCEECGFEGYNSRTGKTILEIDHIDGNCHNNKDENLRVICPNCHAMSSNYKALNKGSGRTYRKMVV